MTGPKSAPGAKLRAMTRARRDTAHTMTEESTTPDLVELTRSLYDAVDRRDLDSWIRLFAPDAVLEATTVAERFEGRTAIRGFLEDWLDMFDQYETKPDEILDLGHSVVFVANRLTARLPGSDAELRMRDAHVYEWAERMVVRITLDTDIDAARAAAERLAASRG
jgi:ketosteroid isomerase-like protein